MDLNKNNEIILQSYSDILDYSLSFISFRMPQNYDYMRLIRLYTACSVLTVPIVIFMVKISTKITHNERKNVYLDFFYSP